MAGEWRYKPLGYRRVKRYRNLARDTDRSGNERIYYRKPGAPKVRLRAPFGTPEFDAEYRRAVAGKVPPKPEPKGAPPVPGSMNAFCVAYYQSREFRQLDPRTRRVRQLILDRFRECHGAKPTWKLQPHHIKKIRDARADKPEAANGLLKALRAVFRFAVEEGLCHVNPVREVSYLPGSVDGFRAWTEDDVTAFEACHPIGTTARLALALLLYTTQRRADVIAFGPAQVKDGRLTFTQHKNRNRKPVTMALPLRPQLREVIEASASGHPTFLVTELGKPFTAAGFGNRFRKWCNEAGLPKCSAHGLRKLGAALLAEAGSTPHEIASVTGHRTLKEVTRYTNSVKQKRLAEAAFARLDAADAARMSRAGAPTPTRDESDSQPLARKEPNEGMVPGGGFEPPTLRFSVAAYVLTKTDPDGNWESALYRKQRYRPRHCDT